MLPPASTYFVASAGATAQQAIKNRYQEVGLWQLQVSCVRSEQAEPFSLAKKSGEVLAEEYVGAELHLRVVAS